MKKPIYKVGAIILKNKKLLVVRKDMNDRMEYLIPGGKSAEQENQIQALKRELHEELNMKIRNARFFGRFNDIAIFENVPLVMDVYIVTVSGPPSPHAEIKEYLWIDRNYHKEGIILGTILERQIVPCLVKKGLM